MAFQGYRPGHLWLRSFGCSTTLFDQVLDPLSAPSLFCFLLSSLVLLLPTFLMQVIIEFLQTGRYRWWVPFISSVRFTDTRAPKASDFVGLNYYRSVGCLLTVVCVAVAGRIRRLPHAYAYATLLARLSYPCKHFVLCSDESARLNWLDNVADWRALILNL